MTAKRTLVLLLSLLMLVCPLLVACGDNDSDNASDASQGTTSTGGNKPGTGNGASGDDEENSIYLDENGYYTVDNLDMPEFNFTDTVFTVCVYNNVRQDTYYSEEIVALESSDSALQEGVKARNDIIEEKYGVKIETYPVEDVAATLKTDATAGDAAYDAAMPFMGQAAALAQDGTFYNLYDFADYLHLDAPWWDQSANENLSIAGKLYFTTGDISIMQKIVSSSILFNKDMYNELCLDTYGDMYQLVRDGKWTLDTMYEMGKLATMETDGVTGMSYNDNWGMVGTNGVTGFYTASGNKLITKDNKDIPQIEFGTNESTVLYAEKILNMFQDASWFTNTEKIEVQWTEKNVWEAAMGAFGNKRCLFSGSAFSALKKLRHYDVDSIYGIVPLPKASVEQEKYYTPANIVYAYGICIPLNVVDPEFSAFMIEVMACGGKNYVSPAYYEVALKSRAAKDDGSEEMLDIIFGNVVYDLGVLYNFGGINVFGGLMKSGTTSVASQLQSIETAVQSAIDEYVEAYELND